MVNDMPDREWTIRAMEHCVTPGRGCTGCPYYSAYHDFEYRCMLYVIEHALALLKEDDAQIRTLKLALDIAKG